MVTSEFLTAAESVLKKEFRPTEPAALLQSDSLLWVKEAYDIIVDQLRDYIASDSTVAVNAQVEYDFPADLFGDIESIIAITIANKGLDRAYLHDLSREYRASSILTLDGKTFPQVFTKLGNQEKYAILPAPTTGGGLTKMVYYVKDPTLPTAITDVVPRYFASGFRQPITDYLISRASDCLNGPGAGDKYFERFMLSINAKKAVKFLTSRQYDITLVEDENNK